MKIEEDQQGKREEERRVNKTKFKAQETTVCFGK